MHTQLAVICFVEHISVNHGPYSARNHVIHCSVTASRSPFSSVFVLLLEWGTLDCRVVFVGSMKDIELNNAVSYEYRINALYLGSITRSVIPVRMFSPSLEFFAIPLVQLVNPIVYIRNTFGNERNVADGILGHCSM